ncbi:phosphoribosylaminoimidazolesuccinocarboxamide synthase [Candidatus Altiarchaeota archaeon]
MAHDIVLTTDFKGLKLHSRGKVRDIYDLGDSLLMVASDRISAFDSILPNGIPGKGIVLNKLSEYWFNQMSGIIDNHMILTDVADYPDELKEHSDILAGRSMIVEKVDPLPIECVARGYITGSGWKEYMQSQTVCGIELPEGLKESEKLPEDIFTPATKAESGHDENIPFSRAAEILGGDDAASVRDHTLGIYGKARDLLAPKGIIIADTKFEFGRRQDGTIILIDEVLTPDSSRFWPADTYMPGGSQKSFDKQYVRDYLEKIGWDKEPPAPELPDSVVSETSRKYLEAYSIITGETLKI